MRDSFSTREAGRLDTEAPHHLPSARRRHLNQEELANRWRLSQRTLERWRWLKIGPDYVKVGARVIYRLEDVETFEAERLRGPVR